MFASELRAFHAVAQSGSIRRAAELLDTAPSSVSRKVGLLEQQIGTTLLERTSNGVTLTHAGAMVAEYARSVDVRIGGGYRLVFRHPMSDQPMVFFGTYREVTPNERIVWTNEESDEGAVTTVTFEENAGKTLNSFGAT